MPSLYISSTSLALGFLPKLALGYAILREHRLIASITIFVRRREALVLRDYQRDFITRLKEDRTSQELGWPIPLKR